MTASKRGGKRPGAGRPRLDREPLATVAFRIDRAQLAALTALLGVSESEALRVAVAEALERRAESNNRASD